jgi:hypothetical protein
MVRMSLKVRSANVSRDIPCRSFQRGNDDMKAEFIAATLTMFFYGLALAIFVL